MKKLFIFLLLGMFLISFSSALLEVSKEVPSLKEDLRLQISESANKYPAITIEDNWGLPLLSSKKADLVLTEHQESCGIDCFSEFTIVTYEDSALVDNVKFYTLIDDGVTLDEPREQAIRNYQLSYWGNVIDYETQCNDLEVVKSENGTEYTPQECSQVEVGNHDAWISFNLGQKFDAGSYKVKLTGEKRPTRSVDWIIETQGAVLNQWAIWGAYFIGTEYQIVLTADSVNTSNLAINGINVTQIGSKMWKLNSSYSGNESRARIMKTLFYGTNGGDARILNVVGLTNINTNYDFDNGMRAYHLSVYSEGAGASMLNGTFTSSKVSSWSNVQTGGSGGVQKWEVPNGNILNQVSGYPASSIEIGTDTTADNSGSTTSFRLYGAQNTGLPYPNTQAIVLINNSVSFTSSGAGVNYVDYTTTHSVPIINYNNAGILLNSPSNLAISSTPIVTFNSTATVTGGATLTNMSLWTNTTGSWAISNTSSVYTGEKNITESHNQTFTDTTSENAVYQLGFNITVNYNTTITSLIKDSSSQASYARVYLSNGTLLQQSSFSGNVALFNTNLTTNKVYWVVVGHSGTFNSRYKSGASYPYNNGNVNFVKGIRLNAGVFFQNSDYLFDIVSINTTTPNTFATSTQTWNLTIPQGSTIWNVQACDSDGACGFATSNYTVTLDATPPVITMVSGNGTQNYGNLLTNHTLNYTITDSNLASCRLQYNGTNRTIPCTSGAYNQTNFTLQLGVYNATIFANDTAGNWGSTLVTWNYLLFGNQTIYDAATTTTSSETFTLVTNKDSSIASISANLWYNGAPYLSTVTTSGNNVNISNTFEIPSGIAIRPFFWEITLVGTGGTTYINTSSLNQTVSNLSLGFCTAPSTSGLTLNFTTYDTATDLPINSTFQATFSYYAQGGSGTVLETYNYQNLTGNRSNYLFCLNSSGINVTLDAHVEYAKTGYDPRSYIINDGIIGNFTQTIPLYLTATSLTDIVTVTVQDQNYNSLQGALVTIQEWNIGTNTYSTIGMFTTSSEGTGLMDLELYTTWYRAIITYNGEIVKVTDVQKLSGTNWNILVELGVDNPYDLFGSISHGLVFSNSTNITTFSWVDNSGYVNTACMYVQNSTSLGYVTIYSDCVNSVAGSINYQLLNNGTYQIYGIIYLTADYENVSQITDTLIITLGESQLSAIVSPFGKVITFLLVGTASLIGVASGSPIVGLLLLLASLFGAGKMGWIKGVEIIIWGLISVAAIIIARQSRRNG